MGPGILTLVITLAIFAVAVGGYIFGAISTEKGEKWRRVLLLELAFLFFFAGALTIIYLLYLSGVFNL